MREAYLEIIEEKTTEEERRKIAKYLKEHYGKDELTLSEIPDCFGFFDSRLKECMNCLLQRVCRISVVELTIPYAFDFLLQCDNAVKKMFVNELHEILKGVENKKTSKEVIMEEEKKTAERTEEKEEAETKIEASVRAGEQKRKTKAKAGLRKEEIEAGKPKKEESVLPIHQGKENKVDRFGFRVNSQQAVIAQFFDNGVVVDEIVPKVIEAMKSIGREVDEKVARRLIAQTAYFIRKKGFNVKFDGGKIILKSGSK
jgi:hypothetical protein